MGTASDTLDICYSGAAEGADELFGIMAGLSLHQVQHFTYEGHKYRSKKAKSSHLRILTKSQLLEADSDLRKVNKVLKRTFPARSEDTNDLLRRNWWQIKDTERVYAVSSISKEGLVAGGTAWAVHLAIIREVPEIYVFDQDVGFWYQWDEGWHKLTNVNPFPPRGKYTGIGTRKLNDAGRQAIKNLYSM